MEHELSKLFRSIGKGSKYAVLLVLRCPFDALLTLLQASFLHYAFEAIRQGNLNGLKSVCMLFGIASILLFLYNGTIWSCFAAFVTKLGGSIRRKLFEAILKLSLSQIEEKSYGEWFTRLNMDVQMAMKLLSGPITLPHALVAVVNILVSSMFLCGANPMILGITFLFLLPHIFISHIMIAKPMTMLKKEVQEVIVINTAHLDTFITAADTVILYDAEKFILQKFEESSRNILRVNMKIHKRNALGSALIPLFGMVGYLAILYIGGKRISIGKLSFGELVAALQFRGGILVGSFMLMNCMVSMKANIVGVTRVNEIIGDIPDRNNKVRRGVMRWRKVMK